MTPPEEVNSDKDDDIDSFFVTVQNPTATVSLLEQPNKQLPATTIWDVQSQLKEELFIRMNTPLPASAASERLFSSRRTNFNAKTHHSFQCELRTPTVVQSINQSVNF